MLEIKIKRNVKKYSYILKNLILDVSLACCLLGFYVNKINAQRENRNLNQQANEIFEQVKNPLKCLHPYAYSENVLDRNLMWICIQFLSRDLNKHNNSENVKSFVLKLWRNFVTQLEIIGLWDIAIYLILLIQES